MIYGGYFEPESKLERKTFLENEITLPDFWSDKKKSEEVIAELNNIKSILNDCTSLKNKIYGDLELIESYDLLDDDLVNLLNDDKDVINDSLVDLENLLIMNGPYDQGGAIIEIHPGAGGTEAQDWALMLYRMYSRFCEKKNFKVEVMDYQDASEAGIKSVSMLVKGMYAYGFLKYEKGVHRLIRISPFDSGARRHTSFASVDEADSIVFIVDGKDGINSNDYVIRDMLKKSSKDVIVVINKIDSKTEQIVHEG